jgi:hypothetical protein
MGCTNTRARVVDNDTNPVLDADELSEESLSRIASKFRVVLFGVGKTLYAPPDQPALQVLLQYRNLYELSVKEIQGHIERHEAVPPATHARAMSTLERMWGIIRVCMQEYNKAMYNKARLISAERLTHLRLNPSRQTVPNPGYSTVPTHNDETDLIILDPTEPSIPHV